MPPKLTSALERNFSPTLMGFQRPGAALPGERANASPIPWENHVSQHSRPRQRQILDRQRQDQGHHRHETGAAIDRGDRPRPVRHCPHFRDPAIVATRNFDGNALAEPPASHWLCVTVTRPANKPVTPAATVTERVTRLKLPRAAAHVSEPVPAAKHTKASRLRWRPLGAFSLRRHQTICVYYLARR